MKFRFRHFLYLVFVAIMAVGIAGSVPADAAKKRASTSQSSSKKKSSGKKSSSSSRKSSGKKSSRKSSKKGNSKGRKGKKSSSKKKSRSTRKSAPAPKEVVSNDSLTLLINEALTSGIAPEINPGGLRVNLVKPEKNSNQVKVQLNKSFTYLPVNMELINGFEKTVKESLPDSISGFSVIFNVGNRPYTRYISTIDKLPPESRKNVPFVVEANPAVHPVKGMEGDVVAMWHSHGRYYNRGSWQWQRPPLFQTLEDIYTMSYVLPFLAPMLENAGAYVMLPRERDTNPVEVIVDNDTNPYGEVYSQTTYREMDGAKKWETGKQEGFIYDIPDFRDTENPFTNGTYRQVETVKSGKTSVAGWYADIPRDGEYAVYVSYKSIPESTTDARYTVNYSGGSKEFIVNQTMGGGTWIYLGTFPLKAGLDDKTPVVALSNKTEKGGNTKVTADAVKIGGGMGNIARSPRRSDVTWGTDVAQADTSAPATQNFEDSGDAQDESEETVSEESEEEDDDSGDDEEDDEGDDSEDDGEENKTDNETPAPTTQQGPPPRFMTSGLPRFLEGARYWLHWAGFPESVYSTYNGNDDYKDDYTSRGKWVNYLAGGSRVLPNRVGLRIPVDISFAFHTDAGKRSDDSFIGTLGISYPVDGGNYPDGTPHNNSRILTNMITTQIVSDVRKTYEPRWSRRGIWDEKSYAEARYPEVPAALLELLSHQNFADMQYGLDPGFRFSVARSIYKAMGRFISQRKDREFIVQPLPVEAFSIQREKKGVYRLRWKPKEDPLEPTAMPTKYIIMERTEGDLGFRRIKETKATSVDVEVKDNKIHSYYIVAANEGGVSFPSEILAVKEGNGKPVLIVNGFTRVSGPKSFSSGGRAGFLAEEDFGVPYKYDISFGGYQREFSRGAGESFGRSSDNHVATVAGGNTFDYPAVHGDAIAAAGRGFVSTSLKAVEDGTVKLTDYSEVDLILGKQKRTVVGNGKSGVNHLAFPAWLQTKLKAYLDKGGDLIISGQNIVGELYDDQAPVGSREFAEGVLGIADSRESKSRSGRVRVESVSHKGQPEIANYSNTLRRDNYIVEQVDIIAPAEGVKYQTLLTMPDNGDVAGIIVEKGKSSITLMSVPFESLTDRSARINLMKKLLENR